MYRFVAGCWAARALTLAGCGLGLLGAMPAGAATALAGAGAGVQAGPPVRALTLTLTNDGATVRTRNGRSWVLEIDDTNSSGGLVATIYRGVAAGGVGEEEHSWQFASDAASLAFSKTTGKGEVCGGPATGRLASLKLAFQAASHRVMACARGSETVYKGTLAGEAELVTGLSGGGTIGGKSITFNTPGSTPEIIADSGCVRRFSHCTASITFDSGQPGGIGATGFTGALEDLYFSFVQVDRQIRLSSPPGASRTDVAQVYAGAPQWNPKTGVLSVTSSSDGLVTGSATLTGKPTISISTCRLAGKTYTVKTAHARSARYASSPGKALTGHPSLGGTMTAPGRTHTASFTLITVS